MEPNKQQPAQTPDQVDPTTKQLGSIVAAHETDGPKPPSTGIEGDPQQQASGGTDSPQQPETPTLPLPSPDPNASPSPKPSQDPGPVPGTPPTDQDKSDVELAQRPDVTLHPQDKTIKLPVPTSVLPALVIGILVLVLLLAVAALAFI